MEELSLLDHKRSKDKSLPILNILVHSGLDPHTEVTGSLSIDFYELWIRPSILPKKDEVIIQYHIMSPLLLL